MGYIIILFLPWIMAISKAVEDPKQKVKNVLQIGLLIIGFAGLYFLASFFTNEQVGGGGDVLLLLLMLIFWILGFVVFGSYQSRLPDYQKDEFTVGQDDILDDQI